jgi:hypothetical protein
MRRYLLVFVAVLLLVIMTGAVQGSEPGQDDTQETCPAIVESALEAVDNLCRTIGRNQACYGNIRLDAEPQPGVTNFTFERAGDIVDVEIIHSLKLSSMDAAAGEWGVSLMRLQANLPDTAPGQNLTFVLFGDVQITNAVGDAQFASSEYTPMQAFYLTTGIGDARCHESPESGLLVQTPRGMGEVSFVVNEITVQLGSTVLFQAQPGGEMIVTTLEGSAVLIIDGEYYVAALPLGALDHLIAVTQPLSEVEISLVHQRIDLGLPLCGTGPLPPCVSLPLSVGGAACILPRQLGDAILTDDDRALCDTSRLDVQIGSLELSVDTELLTTTTEELLSVVDDAGEVVSTVVEPAAEVVTDVTQGVTETAVDVVDTASSAVEEVTDVVTDVTDELVDMVDGVARGLTRRLFGR